MKHSFALLILLFLLSGCKPNNHKAIYFEYYSYCSSCFGRGRYFGWVMDQDGNILFCQNRVPSDMDGYVSVSAMDQFVSNCNVIGKVDVHEVVKHKDLIASVVHAKIINEGSFDHYCRCCYYCYWYDSTQREYKKVLLRDLSVSRQKNIPPNAKTLASWMYSIGSKKCEMMNPDSLYVVIPYEGHHSRRHHRF